MHSLAQRGGARDVPAGAAHRVSVGPQRRGAGKGPGRERSAPLPASSVVAVVVSCDGRPGENRFPLVSLEPLAWTAEPRTAEELARRLITLICAGRNRRNMIRRELPRTNSAGWVRRLYRIILLEGFPFRGPSAVIGAAVQQDFTTLRYFFCILNCASA